MSIKYIDCKTQAELNALEPDEVGVTRSGSRVDARSGSRVDALSGSRVDALSGSHVDAWSGSHVKALSGSHVDARSGSHVDALSGSHVKALSGSHVDARSGSHVKALSGSHVDARSGSRVDALSGSHVNAWSGSHVNAWSGSHVNAWSDSRVDAWSDSRVDAHGSRPCIYVQSRTAVVSGGAQIVRPRVFPEWAAQFGARVEDGVAYLFKAVDGEYMSLHGETYAPGMTPCASDWDDGEEECGGGLHFCADPLSAKEYHSAATRFVCCPVRVGDIAVTQWGDYPSKVKAKGCCAPVWEVDEQGERMEQATEVQP